MRARPWFAMVLVVMALASRGAALDGSLIATLDQDLETARVIAANALADPGTDPKAMGFLTKSQKSLADARTQLAQGNVAKTFVKTKEGLNKLLGASFIETSISRATQNVTTDLFESSRALLRASIDEATLANAPGAASAETLYETVLRAIGDGYVGSVFTRMKKTFAKVAKFVEIPG